MSKARRAAEVIFQRRSPLGLVGSSLTTTNSAWVSPDATIGPLGDSYYEYLLKVRVDGWVGDSNPPFDRPHPTRPPTATPQQAYLMFGDRSYLDMFVTLYTSAMAHMRLPGLVGGPRQASFLVDINMHSGRMAKVWVSSLGAFWPAMQVLAGVIGGAGGGGGLV